MRNARARFVSAFLVLFLAGCAEEHIGSPDPPSAYGKVAASSAGCPAIDGTYRWPPKDGKMEGYDNAGKARRDRYATPYFFDVTFQGDTTFTVKTAPKQFSVAVAGASRAAPSHSEIVRGQRSALSESTTPYECSKGWVVVKERGHPHAATARENYGGTPKLGAKLVPLEDGDLLVAQWVRVTDRTGSIVTWGERSSGSRPLPDKIHWRWARFERLK